MKTTTRSLCALILALPISFAWAQAPGAKYNNADFKLKNAEVKYESSYDALVFEIKVEGQAGKTVQAVATCR